MSEKNRLLVREKIWVKVKKNKPSVLTIKTLFCGAKCVLSYIGGDHCTDSEGGGRVFPETLSPPPPLLLLWVRPESLLFLLWISIKKKEGVCVGRGEGG